jgi:hypothetical protein
MAAPASVGGFCPHCGSVALPNHAFCSKCGVRLTNQASPNRDDLPVCGNCGTVVDMSGAFCWGCGVPLDTGRAPRIPEGALEPPGGGQPRVGGSLGAPDGPSGRATPPPLRGRGPPRGSIYDVEDGPPKRTKGGSVALAVVVTAAVAIAATWGLAYAGYLPLQPASVPTQPNEIYIDSVTIHVDYTNSSNQYLGATNQSGCDYENCPLVIKYSPNPYNVAQSGNLNVELLCSICLSGAGSHTATVTSLTSTPAGWGFWQRSHFFFSEGQSSGQPYSCCSRR